MKAVILYVCRLEIVTSEVYVLPDSAHVVPESSLPPRQRKLAASTPQPAPTNSCVSAPVVVGAAHVDTTRVPPSADAFGMVRRTPTRPYVAAGDHPGHTGAIIPGAFEPAVNTGIVPTVTVPEFEAGGAVAMGGHVRDDEGVIVAVLVGEFVAPSLSDAVGGGVTEGDVVGSTYE